MVTMTDTQEAIPVRFIHTDHGEGRTSSTPEPEFSLDWPPIDQLRWKAGCANARTGLHIRVGERHSPRPGYVVDVDGHGAIGPLGFGSMWVLLTAVSMAVEAIPTKTEEPWTAATTSQ